MKMKIFLYKKIKLLFFLLILITALSLVCYCQNDNTFGNSIYLSYNEEFFGYDNSSKNITVSFYNKANEIVKYCKNNNFNSVVLEVRQDNFPIYKSEYFQNSNFESSFNFFDLIKYLSNKLNDNDIKFFLSISFINISYTEVNTNYYDILNLIKTYNIDGIVLNLSDYYGDFFYADLLSKKLLPNSIISCIIKEENLEKINFGNYNVVSPIFNNSSLYYSEKIKDYCNNNIKISPFIKLNSNYISENCTEIFCTEELGCEGFILSSFTTLNDNNNYINSFILSLINNDNNYYNVDYSPCNYLNLIKPSNNFETSYSSYFVLVNSDPNIDLFLDGKLVERTTNSGVFGILLNLKYGKNDFIFSQENNELKVTIVRTEESSSPVKTNKITSMFPEHSSLSGNGETIEFSCIGPSNCNIYAYLGNEYIKMTQVSDAKDDIPATYKANFVTSGASDDEVKDLGIITYKIEENGSTFESNGHVYVYGVNASPTVSAINSNCSLYFEDNIEEGSFKSVFKNGTTDYVISSNKDYYLLNSGWVKKSDVKVNTFDYNSISTKSRIFSVNDDSTERIIIEGLDGLPFVFNDYDNFSELKIYNIIYPDDIDINSEIYKSIDVFPFEQGIVFRFFYDETIWSLDVLYENGSTVIYSKKWPSISDDNYPLKGIKIVVNPGHGGSDPGAISCNGDSESNLNFSVSSYLKNRLENLGAEVYMTRESIDEYNSYVDILSYSQKILPDFFIAVHHNSMVQNKDANKIFGVESYYYSNFGKKFANNIACNISKFNNRDINCSEYGYYIVLKNRFCPSALCELGYLSNPYENDCCNNKFEIFKSANSICESIIQTINK